MTQLDQYYKNTYLLGPKCIKAWIFFTWEDNTDNEDPVEVFDKFESSFLIPNTQCIYTVDTYSIKYPNYETVEQDISLTIILPNCSYPQEGNS